MAINMYVCMFLHSKFWYILYKWFPPHTPFVLTVFTGCYIFVTKPCSYVYIYSLQILHNTYIGYTHYIFTYPVSQEWISRLSPTPWHHKQYPIMEMYEKYLWDIVSALLNCCLQSHHSVCYIPHIYTHTYTYIYIPMYKYIQYTPLYPHASSICII